MVYVNNLYNFYFITYYIYINIMSKESNEKRSNESNEIINKTKMISFILSKPLRKSVKKSKSKTNVKH